MSPIFLLEIVNILTLCLLHAPLSNPQFPLIVSTTCSLCGVLTLCFFHTPLPNPQFPLWLYPLQGVLTLKNTHFEPRYVLIMPLERPAHERRLREREMFSEAQIEATLDRAEMYAEYNRQHPGFFDMMINSGELMQDKFMIMALQYNYVNSVACWYVIIKLCYYWQAVQHYIGLGPLYHKFCWLIPTPKIFNYMVLLRSTHTRDLYTSLFSFWWLFPLRNSYANGKNSNNILHPPHSTNDVH